MRLHKVSVASLATLALMIGCHQNKTPQATAQDVEATQQEAQKEVAEARVEASKGVKSAAKTMGANSKGIVEAKITASYDVAMTQAEGDHKVAIEKCLTLQADLQPACRSDADAGFETAKATAKAARTAHHP